MSSSWHDTSTADGEIGCLGSKQDELATYVVEPAREPAWKPGRGTQAVVWVDTGGLYGEGKNLIAWIFMGKESAIIML